MCNPARECGVYRTGQIERKLNQLVRKLPLLLSELDRKRDSATQNSKSRIQRVFLARLGHADFA